MNLHFYKGNPKNTGTACAFQSKGPALFINFIKQFSWNESRKLGSFRENMKNPEKTGTFKFNPVEAAGMIDALERNNEYKFYHSSPNGISIGKFCPYIRDGNQIGYSLSVSKEQKGDTVNKNSFLIGFTFAEAILVKEFLYKLISNSFEKIDEEKADSENVRPSGNAGSSEKPSYSKAPAKSAQSEAEAQAEELIF